MSRGPATLREAVPADADFLAEVWEDSLRVGERDRRVADMEAVIAAAAETPRQRLLIAECDGERAGAVLLRAGTISPLNLEPTVHVLAPCVLDAHQRRGVGHTLMEGATAFAEELGISRISSAAAARSRDGNRYLARLGFGSQFVLRTAAVATVRSRLSARGSAVTRSRTQLGHVLAARRSMRRREPVG